MSKKSTHPSPAMLIFKRTLPAMAAATALAGCSMMPTYERPGAPVAAQWPNPIEQGRPTEPSVPVADLPWPDYFVDATLRQVINIALLNNRDLRVAVLNIEQARAQLGLRRADQLPTLNAITTGSRAPTSSGGISSNYAAGLAVTAYEIDFFGRVASLKDQALALYLASAEGSKSAQIALISTVANTWLSLVADEELLSLTRQTMESRVASLKLVQLRFDNGASSGLDLRLSQSLVEAARITLAQQQRQRALDENALMLLLGQPVPTEARARLASSQLTALQLQELPAGLPSDLLARRPDIRQAEQQLIAANANIGAARAAFFPRISLTAGLGSASNELGGLLKSGSWGFTLAPQLLLPLFDAGRNQAGLDSSKVGRDIALAQYEKSIQSAFREVADALAGRETLARQLQATQNQLESESARLRLTNLRLQNGAASQLESLDAQRSLFSAQQALVQTRLAYLQNQVVLFKTLGGGATGATSSQ